LRVRAMSETVENEENKEEGLGQSKGLKEELNADPKDEVQKKANEGGDSPDAEADCSDAEEKEPVEKKEDDFKKKFYYLAAEMENMKRRFSKEKEHQLKFGNERILSSLLDVVDNLERTMNAMKEEEDERIKKIADGVSMVHGQFIEVLGKYGLDPIESVGKQFDPNFHEAMTHQAMDGKDDDEVISEYQKGYVLNGRLLRPSKVIVVKN
jgi:molecular chaperone GrpE